MICHYWLLQQIEWSYLSKFPFHEHSLNRPLLWWGFGMIGPIHQKRWSLSLSISLYSSKYWQSFLYLLAAVFLTFSVLQLVLLTFFLWSSMTGESLINALPAVIQWRYQVYVWIHVFKSIVNIEFLKGDTSFLFMHGQRYLRNLKFQIVPSTFICEQMTRVIAFHQQTKEVYLPKITDWARHIAL